MESELGLPPPAKRPPSAPTTITDIGEDLLCEIFLLLPSLPSLVRAALACHTFLHAVRSSPAFRRRFQALHRPQILGFFIEPSRTALPTFAPLRSGSDLDLAAAVRGSDFFLTRLPEDSAYSDSGWEMQSCHGGYVVLINLTTDQIAAYKPLTHELDIFPLPPEEVAVSPLFDFHIVISEEGQPDFRMVFVQRLSMSQLRVSVFSSATREWKVLPWVEAPTPPQPEDDGAPPTLPQPEDDADGKMLTFYTGMQVNGSVYWKHTTQAFVLVLNTETLQFSRMDLPAFLREIDSKLFRLGQTRDGNLCMVGADDSDAETGAPVVWFWRADGDGVEKWMLEDIFPLDTFINVSHGNGTVQVEAVINGFVYLSTKYVDEPESLLSLCLETGKLNMLFDYTYTSPAHPYIMVWPRSLVECNKEDSQTKVTGDSVADVGHLGTKQSPYLLDVENSRANKASA